MSVGYTWVQWSTHKRVYDLVAAGSVVLFIAGFVGVSKVLWQGTSAISDEVLIIRATGASAIVLLHVILCIGPLARLDRRFLPILYNRRHLGVMTFLVSLVHGVIVTGYYHGFGSVFPLLSLLTSNTAFTSLGAFPFEILGVGALAILFLLAATSHDFWLKNLSAKAWKRLHMSVYLAYVLLVAHVCLGALQTDRGVLGPLCVGVGVVIVSSLHLLAARREARTDRGASTITEPGSPHTLWIDAGTPEEIPDGRARVVCAPGGERIAVFKHDNAVSAVTNVCAHQGGPLGEGKVIDGCITCPWHGWQYRPGDGCSPPPFQEKISTYEVRITAGRVEVNATPLPPGTPTVPAKIAENTHA